MKNFLFLLLPLAGLIISSCSQQTAGTRTVAMQPDELHSGKTMTVSEKEVAGPIALEVYLRRVPGVIVRGAGMEATVQVRGVNSFHLNTEPLFIVNGVPVGNSFKSAATLVSSRSIKTVRVLKDSDASMYGTRGAGGVVLITAD